MKVYVATNRMPEEEFLSHEGLMHLLQEYGPRKLIQSLLAAKRALTADYLEEGWGFPYPLAVSNLVQLQNEGKCQVYDTEDQIQLQELGLFLQETGIWKRFSFF